MSFTAKRVKFLRTKCIFLVVALKFLLFEKRRDTIRRKFHLKEVLRRVNVYETREPRRIS